MFLGSSGNQRRFGTGDEVGTDQSRWAADAHARHADWESAGAAGKGFGEDYDVFGNLRHVYQGSQMRTFTYDSLSRLRTALNPESGQGNYTYDDNGNLTRKTDARGIDIDYDYDALNRNTTVNYSSTSTNPDITRVYDGAINGKGRFWHNYAGGDYTTNSVEHTAIDSYDAAGRPLIQRQLYRLNGEWSPTYKTERSYNLAGGVTMQKYPSDRTVTYNYDNSGRLADKDAQNLAFTGNLGDGAIRTYSRGIGYSPFGGMTIEQFGTDTPLYHKLQYNVRGQLWDIRVATGADVNGSWNRGALQFFYDQTYSSGGSGADNNGNLLATKHYRPLDESSSTWTLSTDEYSYDALNRISSVIEKYKEKLTPGGQPTGDSDQFRQSYLYDPYANRRIDINPTQTWGGVNNQEFAVEPGTNRLYSPGDLALAEASRRMQYDSAGNLERDTYTGAGDRVYDAENRMTKAWGGDGVNNQWQEYTYNADGQRVRRKVNGTETWLIYGMDGELLAEYAQNGSRFSPQKEYGYRNGQLLVTAEAPTASVFRTNFARSSNGGMASASTTYSPSQGTGYDANPPNANNGDRTGKVGSTLATWTDNTPHTWADSLQIEFNGSKTIDEIDVYTLQDNLSNPIEPTEATTFTTYGLTAFTVQYWDGSSWLTIPGGSVSGNNKVWKKFTFSPITTVKIRVVTGGSPDGYSRVIELEAWGNGVAPPKINVALVSNGGMASASSTYTPSQGTGYDANPPNANNGDRTGKVGGTLTTWTDNTPNSWSDWLQVEFNGSKTIDEIDVYTLQDNVTNPIEPTEATTFTTYGLTTFEVQYWDGSSWLPVPGGSVSGNNKVWRKFTFAPITTNKIRVLTGGSPDGYSRVIELEAWSPEAGSGGGGQADTRWLVADHLGTPRMIFDQTGSLVGVQRHDYLPFGEELFQGAGGRTSDEGYTAFGALPADGARQKFTAKERDSETGLDYFVTRHYSSIQGRFSRPDSFNIILDGDGDLQETKYLSAPQNWNLYAYGYNSPNKFVDPSGQIPALAGVAAAAIVAKRAAIGAVVGGAVGGGWELGRQYRHGENRNWRKAGSKAASGAIYGATVGATSGARIIVQVAVQAAGNIMGGSVDRGLDGDDETIAINVDDALTDGIAAGVAAVGGEIGASLMGKYVSNSRFFSERVARAQAEVRRTRLREPSRRRGFEELRWLAFGQQQASDKARTATRAGTRKFFTEVLDWSIDPPKDKKDK